MANQKYPVSESMPRSRRCVIGKITISNSCRQNLPIWITFAYHD